VVLYLAPGRLHHRARPGGQHDPGQKARTRTRAASTGLVPVEAKKGSAGGAVSGRGRPPHRDKPGGGEEGKCGPRGFWPGSPAPPAQRRWRRRREVRAARFLAEVARPTGARPVEANMEARVSLSTEPQNQRYIRYRITTAEGLQMPVANRQGIVPPIVWFCTKWSCSQIRSHFGCRGKAPPLPSSGRGQWPAPAVRPGGLPRRANWLCDRICEQEHLAGVHGQSKAAWDCFSFPCLRFSTGAVLISAGE